MGSQIEAGAKNKLSTVLIEKKHQCLSPLPPCSPIISRNTTQLMLDSGINGNFGYEETGSNNRQANQVEYVREACMPAYQCPHEASFDLNEDSPHPKSMSLLQKWVIVIIVCSGTLCV